MRFFRKDEIVAFGLGVGTMAAGYYFYKKNEGKIHDFLKNQGIDLPQTSGANDKDLSLEELVAAKERYEDLIAEKELLAKEAKPSTKDTSKTAAK